MKSKPSWAAAVSSSRNDFAKHEVKCLHFPRKNLERIGPLAIPRSCVGSCFGCGGVGGMMLVRLRFAVGFCGAS